MISVYLDTCSLQRPLDDRTQTRIAIEAEAVLAILALCESDSPPIQLISSEVIAFEVSQNPHPERRLFATEALRRATATHALTPTIIERARGLEQAGVKAIDALHLATEEETRAAFFCTCDDRFSRRAKLLVHPPTRVVSPLELAQEVLP